MQHRLLLPGALLPLVLLSLLLNAPPPTEAQVTACSSSTPYAICFAAPSLSASPEADCSTFASILSAGMSVRWPGTCSQAPIPPIYGWPLQSQVQVFYSCAQLTSAALYSAWVVRTWALSNVDGNPSFFAALGGLYSGGSNFNQAPTAMWLSYSCQAPRMPPAAVAAIGRFSSCTPDAASFISPPPPDTAAGPPNPPMPPPPPPPDVLGFTRLGCVAYGDATYQDNLSPDLGNSALGAVPSVEACAARARAASDGPWEEQSMVFGLYQQGGGQGAECQAFGAASSVLRDPRYRPSGSAPNLFATWVDDSLCNQTCTYGLGNSSEGGECGGDGYITMYAIGDGNVDGHNGAQECRLIIRPSGTVAPMLALGQVSLYDTNSSLIDLPLLYGWNAHASPSSLRFRDVPFATLSSVYYDFSNFTSPFNSTLNVSSPGNGTMHPPNWTASPPGPNWNTTSPPANWSSPPSHGSNPAVVPAWWTGYCFDGAPSGPNLDPGSSTCCGTSYCGGKYRSGAYGSCVDDYYVGYNYADAYPSLTVTYPCASGTTLGSLGRVEVRGCNPALGMPGDNNPTNINSFQVDFYSSDGALDASSYYFAGSHPNYTDAIVIVPQGIPPPAPLAPAFPSNPSYPAPPVLPSPPMVPSSPSPSEPPPSPPPAAELNCTQASGYDVTVAADHPGDDLTCLQGTDAAAAAHACDFDGLCVAFNVDYQFNHSCLKSNATITLASAPQVCFYTQSSGLIFVGRHRRLQLFNQKGLRQR